MGIFDYGVELLKLAHLTPVNTESSELALKLNECTYTCTIHVYMMGEVAGERKGVGEGGREGRRKQRKYNNDNY